MNYGYYETENDCGRQCQQTVQTRPCGGIPADLTFLLLFWSSKKVEENYIHTDHVGSYCAITNARYRVVQRNCFDPWGNYAFDYYKTTIVIIKGAGDTIPGLTFPITARGFTGHEHYPYFKIINMNGRLYDPVIARFFSPDKYVANSSFTQDFNRYSYARNNPLMHTDPSGENPLLIAMVVGAVIAAATYTISVAISPDGFQNWDWGQFLFSTMLGAASGAFSMGIGGVIGDALAVSGFAGGFVTGAATGLFTGTVTGVMQYATTGNANAIWKNAAMGMGTGAVMGGIAGGINAAAHGANFWDGSFTQDFALPEASDISYEQALKEASILNDIKNPWTNGNDVYLSHTMNKEFAYKAGMLDNGTLTTRAPVGTKGGDYGYIPSKGYYLKADGTVSGGCFVGKFGIPSTYELHISPGVLYGNIIDFRAIAGHELIHAFHAAAFGLEHVESWSESAARMYSYNVYMNAGIYKPNISWGYFPRYYLTPLHFFY